MIDLCSKTVLGVCACALLTGIGPCNRNPPATPPPPPPRVDTLIVTREVAPAPPEGTPAEICLSTGFAIPVLIAADGDTLIGQARVSIKQLRPGFGFEGAYAQGKAWLAKGDPIRFERRVYRKDSQPANWKCEDVKQVGAHDGVPLFADLLAPSPLERILVPVQPGVFQAYKTTLPRRRS